MKKSPFIVYREFFPPSICEDIVDRLDWTFPVIVEDDQKKIVKPSHKANKLTEIRYANYIENAVEELLEPHFGVKYSTISHFNFEWYPEGFKQFRIQSDNSIFTEEKKWKKINQNDFSIVIFMNDHNDKVPFDPDYEVAGGKLEFMTHGFGFNPERGTMIIHPSGPNFAYSISNVNFGALTIMRVFVQCEYEYVYDMKNFLGDYRTWFDKL